MKTYKITLSIKEEDPELIIDCSEKTYTVSSEEERGLCALITKLLYSRFDLEKDFDLATENVFYILADSLFAMSEFMGKGDLYDQNKEYNEIIEEIFTLLLDLFEKKFINGRSKIFF